MNKNNMKNSWYNWSINTILCLSVAYYVDRIKKMKIKSNNYYFNIK